MRLRKELVWHCL